MNDMIASGGPDGHQATNSGAETTLRLLVLWLLHCHDRTRRRQQLGILEPHFRDAVGVNNAVIANARDVPVWR
jgi:hypothetical protein